SRGTPHHREMPRGRKSFRAPLAVQSQPLWYTTALLHRDRILRYDRELVFNIIHERFIFAARITRSPENGVTSLFTRLLGIVILAAGAAFAQIGGGYQGPEILSRSDTTAGVHTGNTVGLRFYADVAGTYDTGFTLLSVNTLGKPVQLGGAYGVIASAGVYGTHDWRTSILSLDYFGDYREYPKVSYINGTDQTLRLTFQHQLSRHMSLKLTESAGTYSYALAGFGFLAQPDEFSPSPTNAIFDNRVSFGQSGVDLIYQKTARLSFSIGGEGNAIRQHAAGLVGLNGFSARADVAYRLNRKTTISADYSYIHYDYEGLFGSSDVHTAALGYSRTLNRNWQVALRAGAFQVETKGLQFVTLDPAVAAILGQYSTIEAYYKKRVYPLVDLKLTGRFRRSQFFLYASQTVNPGNGVYLTSRNQSAGAGYTYTATRKWSLNASGGYNALLSVAQGIGDFRATTGGGSATYALTRSLHGIARFEGRHFDVGYASFKQNSYMVSLGIAFSPGEVPLTLW
ncbi:MAG: hypothetical protein ABI165_04300, partial [Bryobacteraceae bacterium]